MGWVFGDATAKLDQKLIIPGTCYEPHDVATDIPDRGHC